MYIIILCVAGGLDNTMTSLEKNNFFDMQHYRGKGLQISHLFHSIIKQNKEVNIATKIFVRAESFDSSVKTIHSSDQCHWLSRQSRMFCSPIKKKKKKKKTGKSYNRNNYC